MNLLVRRPLRFSPTPKTKFSFSKTGSKIGSKTGGLFLIAAMFASLSPLAHATVYVVSAVSPACKAGFQYTTIGAAVTAAAAGSTIFVCPGTYSEQIYIGKALTLEGVSSTGATGATAAGADAPTIVPPSGGLVQMVQGNLETDIFGSPVAAQIFVASSGSVTIKYLTVDGTGNNIAGCGAPTLEGIYYQNTSGTITYNAVRNQYQTDLADYGGCQNGLAINVESTTSADSVTVSYNSVHAYQKNGITATGAGTGAGSPGPNVTIKNNYIVGLGANALNWGANAPAAENGVQFGFGASGSVSANTVIDNIWPDDNSSQPGNAASGILVFASNGITVSTNYVGSAQYGIAIETDSYGFCGTQSSPISCGPADSAVVTGNKVFGTQIFDGIDLCSNHNMATSNILNGNAESGIHIDGTCTSLTLSTTSGNNNLATANTIDEACAGVLLGTGGSNTYTPNTSYNVGTTTLAGDVCTPSPAKAKTGGRSTGHKRPSPYNPSRR